MVTASSRPHPAEAAAFIANPKRASWHDQTLWFVRSKRDRAASTIPEWEELRQAASQIKQHTLANLGDLLEQFERNAQARGAVVHWARDAAEHNEIVLRLLQEHGAKKIVKSKSMLTEECHLNPFLERNGIEVVDTDLGEWIVQLRKEPPSHIVMPAIHTKREEIGELFHEHIGTEKGATDPLYLTRAARKELRQKFLNADAGLTGVNFAIAETGGFVVCTNEGNADLGTSLPKLHIACMGIEKLIPKAADLGVFLRLLARSATGQPITTYSTHFHGPRNPECELHIVLVDNGRSDILSTDEFRRSLNCIRCGACMNTCPVYRRSGGHSYHNTVPGPIGSILGAASDAKKHYSLPHACSLCGSCSDVCPVKIDLHSQLYTWRNKLVLKNLLPESKKAGMKAASAIFSHPWLYRLLGRAARFWVPKLPRFLVYNPLNPWGKQRELPEFPKTSFRERMAVRKSAASGAAPTANGHETSSSSSHH
ncbi:LutB/LldF family L-lactate oxidation iron-sulfur protein [Planctomyces sp. SH-PL14]|uniref:LutB/LldF family L-lactate oxidation iron-sulfur protein n=1 Tax=Planctomyces sp. SH-PL14 TaxID=1632864 RepID=UPI00078D2FB7|nr:LutB/LldF family L-lactate oxidation iron-sulfur protein [Planctomyces sp. SH-PL14]AMV17061.1 Lactate utilization protein B [Planctomyces sp. SH-PL14]